MSRLTTRLSILSTLIALASASPVAAQTIASTFDELRAVVEIDETITVTDARGATHTGKLAGLSPSTLQLRRGAAPWLAFVERDVNNVVVNRSDGVWNGMLIGFAVGAAPVALIGAGASAGAGEIAAVASGYGGIGLLTGLLIDVLNKQKLTVYVNQAGPRSRISVAPFHSASRTGLQLRLSIDLCALRCAASRASRDVPVQNRPFLRAR